MDNLVLRATLAATIVAGLAERDDKPCRKKSNVLEAIAYVDELLWRLGDADAEVKTGDAGIHGDSIASQVRTEIAGKGYTDRLRDVGA